MRSFKHWSGIIALVLVLSMLLTACTPQAAPTGSAAESTPPATPDAEFERAAEAALRSRHIRDDERPFVRRWFRALVERR